MLEKTLTCALVTGLPDGVRQVLHVGAMEKRANSSSDNTLHFSCAYARYPLGFGMFLALQINGLHLQVR